MDLPMELLQGKKGLVVGIANDQSIAAGCAKAFRKANDTRRRLAALRQGR